MKLTKRKSFSFLRSYFDVLNELEKDKDKLAFLMAIINKQFLDEEPNISGLSKLAYISQQHAIDKSVKGYKDKMKTDLLGNPTEDPRQGCTEGGRQDPRQDPRQQEKEKEKEKEKEQEKGKVVKHWNEDIDVNGYQKK